MDNSQEEVQLTVEEIKQKIQKAKIISFDIFDTLIIRDFLFPIDVFKYIEIEHNIPDFQKKRIYAEAKARSEDFQKNEITYKEIYKNIENVNEQLELDIEYQTCIVNHEVKKLYDYALAEGKMIIAISDMYLDEKSINSFLDKNGFINFDKIYISSLLNMRKSSGNLYQYVIQDLDINPQELVHIGDNFKSDYLQANKNKINGIYYKSFRDQCACKSNNYILDKLIRHNSPQASLLAGLYSNAYSETNKQNYWYQFGFEYGGIILFNFVNYIYNYCKDNHISRLYFMARDGKIIKDVFDMLYGNDKDIETYYMFASRRLFFVSAIKELDENTLISLIESSQGISYLEIIKRLGFDWLIQMAEEYFKDINSSIQNKSDRKSLKQFFKLNEQGILTEAAKERKNLLAYLKEISFLKDNKNTLVDIGWNCTSQKYLESILHREIHAIYFGTNKFSYNHKHIHGYFMYQGLPKSNHDLVYSSPSVAVLELLFIGDHDSIAKIDKNLNPVFSAASNEENKRISIASDIHMGILDFAKKYNDILTSYNLEPEHSLNHFVLYALLVKPRMVDILEISKIPHNAGWGNSIYEPIIKNLTQTQFESFRNIFQGKILENKVLWSKGKFRYYELLNQKHYKSIEKLSFILTKIKQCYSYSFIICIKIIIRKMHI